MRLPAVLPLAAAVRAWRRRPEPPPDPATWACVAAPTLPRLVVWLTDIHELTRTAWFPTTCDRNGDVIGVVWRSCHGHGWCGHCGRQLPGLGLAAGRAGAVAELQRLAEQVKRIRPVGRDARLAQMIVYMGRSTPYTTAGDLFRTLTIN